MHEELFWRKDQMAAARIGDYKLIRLKDGQSVLYNLKNDIVEIKDLSGSEAATVQLLTEKLNRWETHLKKPVWIEPEDWNTVTRMIYEDLMNNRHVRAKTPSDLKAMD